MNVILGIRFRKSKLKTFSERRGQHDGARTRVKIISDVLPEMNFDVNSDTVISAATAFLPQPVEICRTLNQNSEAVEICRSIIMEDVLGDLLDNLEAMEAQEASEGNLESSATTTTVSSTPEIVPKTFFKTLSFYDDPDDDPMLPFESFFETEVPDGPLTEVPSEFTQPFFSSSDPPTGVPQPSFPDSEASVIVTSILDAILDAVPPRKIATVHPFSLNNKDEELVTEPLVDSSSTSGLRLAGFATDPSNASGLTSSENEEPVRPTIKFANFAIDPSGTSSSGTSSSGGIKLANFAKDPDSASSTSWHTRDGAEPNAAPVPPPLTHRPDHNQGGHQVHTPSPPPSPHPQTFRCSLLHWVQPAEFLQPCHH